MSIEGHLLNVAIQLKYVLVEFQVGFILIAQQYVCRLCIKQQFSIVELFLVSISLQSVVSDTL